MEESVKILEVEASWLKGKQFISIASYQSKMLVPFDPNPYWYPKWEKYFLEDQIFDTYK